MHTGEREQLYNRCACVCVFMNVSEVLCTVSF